MLMALEGVKLKIEKTPRSVAGFFLVRNNEKVSKFFRKRLRLREG